MFSKGWQVSPGEMIVLGMLSRGCSEVVLEERRETCDQAEGESVKSTKQMLAGATRVRP